MRLLRNKISPPCQAFWTCWAGAFFILLTFPPTSSHAETVHAPYTEAELVSELATVAPGDTLWAALRLKPHPDWYVYWKNPGDAGMPPSLEWTLPEGVTAQEILFPYPEVIPSGPLASFGFSQEVFYPVRIAISSDFPIGTPLVLNAHADWLVCKVECLPADAELTLILETGEKTPHPVWGGKWQSILERLPHDSPEWKWRVRFEPETLTVTGTIPRGWKTGTGGVFFFPDEQGIIDNAQPQSYLVNDGMLEVKVVRDPVIGSEPDSLQGVLVADSAWRSPDGIAYPALTIAVTPVTGLETAAPAAVPLSMGRVQGMGWALLFALLGGVLLNLMPCVLPVLSLKIMDFVNRAGQRRSLTIVHGLVFTSGVLLSFWILAGTLILLQQGGAQLGWGFQLQSPLFVFSLSAFLFLFGLNLLGVFEMGVLFTRFSAAGKTDSHYLGSFAGGVTATLVATPCTAPFMGAALGYGFTLSPLANLALFTALGFGMASPYLLLSFFPGFLRFLPAPGRWMETLKQFMGFLLLGTVIWLAWVLGHLVGNDGITVFWMSLLCIGIGAWMLGRWGVLSVSPRTRFLAIAAAIVIWALALWFGSAAMKLSAPVAALPIGATAEGSQAASIPEIDWEPFSPERLEELRTRKEPVFVNFTAAWCITCKVNERMALRSPEVIERFSELGIHALKADWTARDASLARVLAGYGRNSIPFYVFYDGKADKPKFLPELLTPGLLLEILHR